MSDEKDEDLETLAEAEEPQPPPAKAKQYKKAEPNDARRKKERTPAQIAAFEKCRAKREENRALRKQEREQEDKAKKQEKEVKIVKKAVRIKKKEKLEQAIMQSSSDDDLAMP